MYNTELQVKYGTATITQLEEDIYIKIEAAPRKDSEDPQYYYLLLSELEDLSIALNQFRSLKQEQLKDK